MVWRISAGVGPPVRPRGRRSQAARRVGAKLGGQVRLPDPARQAAAALIRSGRGRIGPGGQHRERPGLAGQLPRRTRRVRRPGPRHRNHRGGRRPGGAGAGRGGTRRAARRGLAGPAGERCGLVRGRHATGRGERRGPGVPLVRGCGIARGGRRLAGARRAAQRREHVEGGRPGGADFRRLRMPVGRRRRGDRGGPAGQPGPERLFRHHQVLRDEHDGRGSAVGRGPQRDPDAVPLGQLADHEQAELLAVGRVELRRAGQPLVQLVDPLRAHPEPAVLDLDREAAGHRVSRHAHRRVGRRERGGVLDELGQQVDHVGDGRAGQRGLAPGRDGDPRVVLDLGDGAAHHVDHPDRGCSSPGPAARRTG